MAILSGLGGLAGFGQAASQCLSGRLDQLMRQQSQDIRHLNPFPSAKRELSIKDELQKETDEWLRDIKI
jgi:hypothetical protein